MSMHGFEDERDIMLQFSGTRWSGKEKPDDEKIVNDLTDATVISAIYDCANYEGHAFVLYNKGDKNYEVHGSHCSCYGLEGQWEPEEVELPELKARIEKSAYGILRNFKATLLADLESFNDRAH